MLVRDEVGELFQCLKRVIEIPGLLLPIRVLKKVLAGIPLEPLLRVNLAQLVVNDRPPRGGTKDLVAEGNRRVEEATIGVVVHRLLPQRHRLRQVPRFLEHVAHAVVQRDIDRVLFPRLIRLDDIPIDIECLLGLFLGLEVGRLLF